MARMVPEIGDKVKILYLDQSTSLQSFLMATVSAVDINNNRMTVTTDTVPSTETTFTASAFAWDATNSQFDNSAALAAALAAAQTPPA